MMERDDRGSEAGNRVARVLCLAYGIAALVFGYGLYHRAGWATALWPWPDHRLTYLYLGSLTAAIAAPFLWAAYRGEIAAIAPAALDSVVVNGGIGGYLVAIGVDRSDGALLEYGIGSLALAGLFALLFARTRSWPPVDPRPTPRSIRIALAVLAAIVLVVTAGLLSRADGVFPWDLKPETSTLFGMVYLGVATYFAYGVLRPAWPVAMGQFLGFIAYTAVLVRPYLDLLRSWVDDSPSGGAYGYGRGSGADPVNMLSLSVFLTVLAVGTVLAVWALAINPETRVIPTPRPASSGPATEPVA